MEPLNINLYDDITPEVVRDIAAVLLGNPGADVVLHINSPGGEVTSGYALANALKTHTGHKVAVVEGLCASAATFPACACDEIHMHAESLFMVHGPWGEASGGPGEMSAQSDLLTKMIGLCAGMYQRKTGADEAQVREWMSRDTWMTPAEAEAAGFCDKILSNTAPPQARVAAQRYVAKLRRPQNAIKENKTMATNSDEGLLPENLAKKLAQHGWDGKDPEKAKSAYLAYLAATEDGPGERTEMSKAMASVEKVIGEQGEGERADNPITASSDKEDEEKKKKDEAEKAALAKELPPAAMKLITALSKQVDENASKERARASKEHDREVTEFHAYAKNRVTKADADEYLTLSGGNVALARTLVSKFPEKTPMTRITVGGKPPGASSAATETEAAPMASDGRHQLHGFALSRNASAEFAKKDPPVGKNAAFYALAKAQRVVAKNRPDLWG